MDNVLMFSAGLDSFILKEILKYPNKNCLFVRMGTKENKQEELYVDLHFPGVLKTELPISEFELPNKIIPFRNHFLALLGAQFSTNITFAFTAGDTTRDKDFVFKAQMEGLLNYFAGIPSKVQFPNEQYIIDMPFKNMTKVEIVAHYIKGGYSVEKLLTHSKSCYAGGEKACGKCRSCIRKYVALVLNGIESDNWFEESPTEQLITFHKECIVKDRKQETKEVEKCIKLVRL